ncbi:MAG: TolC family protein [Chthoniobacterales bacterium]
MRRLFLPVLLLVQLQGSFAQTDKILDITYNKAITLALQKNFQIKVEEFAPKIARAQQLTASGIFDPTVQASYTYSQSQAVQLATVPGTPDLFLNTTGGVGSASIFGLTPWGMTYNLGGSSTLSAGSQTQDSYTTFGGLNLTQPLLRGFGTDVNLAGIRMARADYSISEWQLRQQVMDTITSTIFFYNELHFYIGNLAVERRSRALAEELYKDNQQRESIGVMSKLDVLQPKADVANRENLVLVAERQVLDNENFLKQLVTDDVSRFLYTHLRIAPPPTMPLDYRIDEPRDLAAALEFRPDFRQALLDLQKQQINVVFRRNATLPQLDLIASLGLNGIDTNLINSATSLTGANNYSWTAGANFSLPIPNRQARGLLEQSKLTVLRSLVDLKRLEQDIIARVDNAAGHVRTTRKRIDATGEARNLAAETLDAGRVKLNAGTSTTFEVLKFQRDLATAEIAEIRAIADYNEAVSQYARETGSTLQWLGITIEPTPKSLTRQESKKRNRNDGTVQ